MVDKPFLWAAADGLSGQSVRGAADNEAQGILPNAPDVSVSQIGETVSHAAEYIRNALEISGQAIGHAVDTASSQVFESAAQVSSSPALGQGSFSWGGYFQAIGILCLLLAALWFGVWCLRRWGRFNFMPRPGSLPKDALIMEAQMPLGPRKGLMVVRFLNRRLLLGVTEHQISLITEANADNERPANTFQSVMDAARNGSDNSGAGHPSA